MIYKPTKNWVVALLLSIFLGSFGIDRFYLGHIGLGIAKLIFSWFTFGIWAVIDVIVIAMRKVDDRAFYWDDSAEAYAQSAGRGGSQPGGFTGGASAEGPGYPSHIYSTTIPGQFAQEAPVAPVALPVQHQNPFNAK